MGFKKHTALLPALLHGRVRRLNQRVVDSVIPVRVFQLQLRLKLLIVLTDAYFSVITGFQLWLLLTGITLVVDTVSGGVSASVLS